MTPKDLRDMSENKALDIGTAWNALEAAADRIETLEAECASLKQRAWRAESLADEKWGLRKELAEALGVSDKCDDEALRAGLAAIRRLENERDDALARLDQYEDRNPVYPADLGRRTSNRRFERRVVASARNAGWAFSHPRQHQQHGSRR